MSPDADLPQPFSSAPAGLPTVFRAARQCGYCGAKLDPTFYFCVRCATPYVDESTVLPELRPQRLFPGRLIRERAPQAMGIFWTFLGTIVAAWVICLLTISEVNLGAQILIQDGLLLLVTTMFAVRYGRALASQFLRPGFTRWEAWAGLALLVPLLAINWGWHAFLEYLGLESISLVALLRDSGFSQGMLIFSICVFPAVTEEIAFRGLVQHWLHVAVQPRQAIIYAAALFTLLHFSVLSAPTLFLAGCLLGWLRWRTGSLWPPIVVHFLHNLAVVAFFEG